MRLQDIMTKSVKTTAPDDSAEKAWETMRLYRLRHLPVVKDGALLGVVSERDLGGKRGESLRRTATVRDLMSDQPVLASPETTLREAANLLRGHAVGCVPVMKKGKLVGIVTVSDVLDVVGRGAERPVATTERRTLRTGVRVAAPARGSKGVTSSRASPGRTRRSPSRPPASGS